MTKPSSSRPSSASPAPTPVPGTPALVRRGAAAVLTAGLLAACGGAQPEPPQAPQAVPPQAPPVEEPVPPQAPPGPTDVTPEEAPQPGTDPAPK